MLEIKVALTRHFTDKDRTQGKVLALAVLQKDKKVPGASPVMGQHRDGWPEPRTILPLLQAPRHSGPFPRASFFCGLPTSVLCRAAIQLEKWPGSQTTESSPGMRGRASAAWSHGPLSGKKRVLPPLHKHLISLTTGHRNRT